MGPTARILPDGARLHLQHGPIDLIIGADGDRDTAFRAARKRFETVLDELVAELPLLKTRMHTDGPQPKGQIARRMDAAARPFSTVFLTRMAAVAGAVADEILTAMTDTCDLRRAYVNNGGDVAIHLHPSERFSMAMAGHNGADLGLITLAKNNDIKGIATSGRHGRSLSLGIADSVTVLAKNAALADVAATLIANTVDLCENPAIQRAPAVDLQPDSDLHDQPVTTSVGYLSEREIAQALDTGESVALEMQEAGLIHAVALFLNDDCRLIGTPAFALHQERTPLHA